MATHHEPVDVDPQTLENSRNLWNGFTTMTKYGVIAVIVLMLGLYFFVA